MVKRNQFKNGTKRDRECQKRKENEELKLNNKVEAEIHFKKWKINKDRQIAEEKRKK